MSERPTTSSDDEALLGTSSPLLVTVRSSSDRSELSVDALDESTPSLKLSIFGSDASDASALAS